MEKDIAQQYEFKTWADFIASKIERAQTSAVHKVNTALHFIGKLEIQL